MLHEGKETKKQNFAAYSTNNGWKIKKNVEGNAFYDECLRLKYL